MKVGGDKASTVSANGYRAFPRQLSTKLVFGVSTIASGRSSVISVPRASRSSSVWLDVDTHMGSITRGGRDGSALSMRAVARTTSALASMPVSIAAASISLRADRSCKLRMGYGPSYTDSKTP